jgi:hypothetical protein
MKFVLLQSLFQDVCSQKDAKNLKEKRDQMTLSKLPFVPCRDNNPLGIKFFDYVC